MVGNSKSFCGENWWLTLVMVLKKPSILDAETFPLGKREVSWSRCWLDGFLEWQLLQVSCVGSHKVGVEWQKKQQVPLGYSCEHRDQWRHVSLCLWSRT